MVAWGGGKGGGMGGGWGGRGKGILGGMVMDEIDDLEARLINAQ